MKGVAAICRGHPTTLSGNIEVQLFLGTDKVDSTAVALQGSVF
jgi:hypothetical protein